MPSRHQHDKDEHILGTCYFIKGLKCNDDCQECDVIEYLRYTAIREMSDDLKKIVYGGL